MKPEEITLNDFDRDTIEEQIIVAVENDHVLGFTSLYVPNRFIHNLFVHPDAAGKGVGDQLLKRGWKAVVEDGEPGSKYWVLMYE